MHFKTLEKQWSVVALKVSKQYSQEMLHFGTSMSLFNRKLALFNNWRTCIYMDLFCSELVNVTDTMYETFLNLESNMLTL